MPAIGTGGRWPIWFFLICFSLLVFSAFKREALGRNAAIIAEVNGVPITRQSFQIDYRQAVNAHARQGNPVNEAYLRTLRSRLIAYLVETELLVQDAAARRNQISDQELDQAVRDDRERFETETQFQAHLQAVGLSLPAYRERRLRNLVIDKLIAAYIAPGVVIRDQDLAVYYQQHAERYRIPARLHIRHITLRFPPDVDESQKSAVRDRMHAIERQIRSGHDFAQLARQYSEDPSRRNGGDLGFVDATQAARKFGGRILAFPTGQVGPPLETPSGYHLVTILERDPEREIPLEVVRDEIRQTLYQQQTRAPVKSYVQQLRANATIVIHE